MSAVKNTEMAAAPASSPFLTIPPLWRALILTYMGLYHIIFPAIYAMSSYDAEILLPVRFLLNFVFVFLTCVPLIFYRKEYGFLHPLILPLLYGILSSLAKIPLHVFLPMTFPLVNYTVSTNSAAVSLNMSMQELATSRALYSALEILALLCYYSGYFVFRVFKVPAIKLYAPRNLNQVCAAFIATSAIVGMLFILINSGSLSSHLIAMRSGRAQLFQGLGPIIFFVQFSVVVGIVWFMYLRRPFANWLWIITFSISGFMTLVISGSRSSLIYALLVLLLLWWKRRNKVLIVQSMSLAVVALLIFAIFGSIRMDWGSQGIDKSVFSVSNIGDTLQKGQEEINKRQGEEGALAAFAGAQNGLLWGRSYLSALSFWIPRAIWNDKPHGAGAYNMWTNFAGKPLDQFGTGIYWGIPLGPVAEAYWNFHIPGVIVVFTLFGAFHRWLSDLVWCYPNSPIVLIFSTWLCINFAGDSQSFLTVMQDLVLMFLLCYLLGILRLGRLNQSRISAHSNIPHDTSPHRHG